MYPDIEDPLRQTYMAMITRSTIRSAASSTALDAKGLRDNTIILFASDNGGATSGMFASGSKSPEEREAEEGGIAQDAKAPAINAPFRGGKGSLYEGGVRVPGIVNWPGKLSSRVVDAPLHMIDVMPTLLALAGGHGDPTHPFDGDDVWTTLAEGAAPPDDDVLINVEAFRGAIRVGDWKLVKVALLPGKTELFNLVDDPGETTNVAEQHPEIVARSRSAPARLCPRSRKPANGSRRSRHSSATRARRSSIPTSTSATTGCRTRRRRFRSSDPGIGSCLAGALERDGSASRKGMSNHRRPRFQSSRRA